jgi:hypothetical protein
MGLHRRRPAFIYLAVLGAVLSWPAAVAAQQPEHPAFVAMMAELPDAPEPQAAAPTTQESSTQSGQNPAPPASSSSQTSSSPSQHQRAEEEIRQEEHQRVLGMVPDFGTSYVSNAVSLTAGQKMQLAFRSAVDPAQFGIAALVAGWGEASDSDSGFPWGPSGFGERFGAKYLDAFDGGMIGGGILPSLFHQDPRYFRLGHGSTTHRLLYAISTSFICKHDNTGRWEPNYSNVLGNIASGALSNLYYPNADSGIGLTIGNGMVVTAEGAAGGVFEEFWPDISRKLFHKDPTHGLDAQMRAADQAATRAKQKENRKQPLPPAPK